MCFKELLAQKIIYRCKTLFETSYLFGHYFTFPEKNELKALMGNIQLTDSKIQDFDLIQRVPR